MSIETSGQMGRSVLGSPIKSTTTALKGLIRKGNPNIGKDGTSKRGSVPPPGPEREARLFKMVAGVRVQGSDVMAAEQAYRESVADSDPASTNGTNVSKQIKNTSSTPVVESPGVSAEGVLASVKSGLTTYMPAILVIGSVILGIVIIKSAGGK